MSQPHGDGLRGLSPATAFQPAPTIRWQRALAAGVVGGYTFSSDGSSAYFCTLGTRQLCRFYRVRILDGFSIWETNPAVLGSFIASMCVSLDEPAGRVYVVGNTSGGGAVLASLSSVSRAVLWTREVSSIPGMRWNAGRSEAPGVARRRTVGGKRQLGHYARQQFHQRRRLRSRPRQSRRGPPGHAPARQLHGPGQRSEQHAWRRPCGVV